MRQSAISHPPRGRFLVIREWLIEFCGGNACAAALISYFESWHNHRIANDEKAKQLNEQFASHGIEAQEREGLLQWHTEAQLEAGLMIYKAKTIREALKFLQDLEIISVVPNPDPRLCFDRTKYFQFNPAPLNEFAATYNADKSSKSSRRQKCRIEAAKLPTGAVKLPNGAVKIPDVKEDNTLDKTTDNKKLSGETSSPNPAIVVSGIGGVPSPSRFAFGEDPPKPSPADDPENDPEAASLYTPEFLAWWKTYPKPRNKIVAAREWHKQQLDRRPRTVAVIMAHTRELRQTPEAKEKGQPFIVWPERYLRGKRYLDHVEASTSGNNPTPPQAAAAPQRSEAVPDPALFNSWAAGLLHIAANGWDGDEIATWLNPCRPIACSGGVLALGVPNEYAIDYISRNCEAAIQEAAASGFGLTTLPTVQYAFCPTLGQSGL
jgi:hypothetical protein